MPDVTVAFWNIQNFGSVPSAKANYNALVGAVAAAVANANVDILYVQELKQSAIGFGHLQLLQQALNALPAPQNNWHYEFIKGAVTAGAAPYATSANLIWDAAHHEGYAIFWNQNLAKFTVQLAPPIQAPAQPGGGGPVPPPAVPNTQSETVRGYGVNPMPAFALYGIAVPGGGVVVPADPAYTVPAGTTPAAGFVDAAGNVHMGGVALGAAATVNSGTVLAAGSQIGAAGVTMANLVVNANPVVVPGGFTLTDPLTLPPPGTVVVPEHALSLVTVGRDTTAGGVVLYPSAMGDISGQTAPFVPGGANAWWYLTFPRAAGQPVSMQGSRRPVFVTISLNLNAAPNPANQLVPVICYHAPSAQPASSTGMQRAAYSRPMYQAYDHVAGAWIDTTRSVLGGDMNVVIDGVNYPYAAFTATLANGGANAQLRVDNPAPPAAPQLAPPPPPPAVAPVGGWDRSYNTLNKTTAQLTSPPVAGVPILNGSTNFYRALAIDNAFYRGFAPANAPMPAPRDVYDLVATLRLGGGAVGAFPAPVVAAFAALPLFVIARNWFIGLAGGPAPTLAGIQDFPLLAWSQSLGSMALPGGGPVNSTNARRAAETVARCISDHLPVLFRMSL